MILRLLLKIGFKACLPLAATLGIIFYMSYMNGGDPVNSARKVLAQSGSGAAGQPGALARMKGSVAGTFDAIFGDSGPTVAAALSKQQDSPEVYRWEDAAGSTHYGTHPPVDAQNIRPVALRSNPQSAEAGPSSTNRDVVPGMPGVVLPGGVQLPEGVDYRRVLGHIEEPD